MSQTDRTAHNSCETLFHPVSHYDSPDHVLGDTSLSTDEKRVILSSWASDMYAVTAQPGLREIPGVPHRLPLDDILAALRKLDGENDPPPRGGLAMQLPRFSRLDCIASNDPDRPIRRPASPKPRSLHALRGSNYLRWTREENVRRYRRLLNTHLTAVERKFIEQRLAEELRGRPSEPKVSVPSRGAVS
jgi:hypothetical protein